MRDHILAEIRRIAAASDGKAPGRRTFERESGITESTWRGVYWARWGDALVEAGLSANAKQEKTDSNLLLSKLAEAVRYFGRTPTLIELRMYRRRDPGFPAHSTLAKHYPAKDDMISALRAWITGRENLDDVAALLPEIETNVAAKMGPIATKAGDGFVYLIKSGDFYKIGRSDDVERRFRQISIALPDKAEMFHAIRTDDPPGIEAYWHRRFADRRANGEWFRLGASDIAAFRKRKFQ